MKVLIVKMSSMGDLIQTLPAITEAVSHMPHVDFHWVVEEAFVEIPHWHSSVTRVIPIANRRWKKNFFQSLKSGEIKNFYQTLKSEHYDYVIDLQSNLKSALITFLANGVRYGVSAQGAREYGAHFAYHQTVPVLRKQNHLWRIKEILGKIFDYRPDFKSIDYNIDRSQLPTINFSLPSRFIFMNHTVSRDNKLWPMAYWKELINDIEKKDYDIVLPWWSSAEKLRAEELANHGDKIHVLPALNLSEKASVISRAQAMVSGDTGLGHLSAALNIPTVVLYGPKDPKLHGTMGENQTHLFENYPSCAPCDRSQCQYKSEIYSPCMQRISPDLVLEQLMLKLRKGNSGEITQKNPHSKREF